MRRLALATCYASMGTLAISLNLMPVCMPLMRLGVDGAPLTNEQLGRISSVTFVGVVAGLLFCGPLANRLHPKWFTIGGNLVIVLGLVALHLSGSYDGVLIGVALMGFGGGTLDMILSPVVCALQPERRAQALNWLHSFFCVGAVLTVLAATVALGRSAGWREIALWMAAPPAVVACAFAFLRIPAVAPEPVRRLGLRQLLSQRFFLLALAVIFLGGATEMGVAQWLPAYAELGLGTPRWIGGAALLAFSVGMALGRMGIGWLGARVSVSRLMVWSSGLCGLLILLAGLCPVAGIALAASILSGLAICCIWPSTLGIVGDRFPLAGASMFGVLAAFGNFGGILMPWCVGIIADRSRIGLGIAATAICPLLMVVALRAMHRIRSGAVAPGVA
jgi:MFS family permease